MDFRSDFPLPTFTRFHVQIIQEDGAFTVSVQMLNHLNQGDNAWGQEIAVSIDMASAMIESIAKTYGILQNCISIKIVMDNLGGWATFPGSSEPNSAVAQACAETLTTTAM